MQLDTSQKTHVISFTGPRKVGKTTTSNIVKKIILEYNLKNNNTYRVYQLSFADFLRDFISKLYGDSVAQISLSPEYKDTIMQDNLKLQYSEEVCINPADYMENLTIQVPYNKTYRDLLITTGTYLRDLNKDIFCIALKERIEVVKKYNKNNIIIIDDLRFENEREFLKLLSVDTSTIVYLEREDYVPDYNGIDFILEEKTDMTLTLNTVENYYESTNTQKVKELLTNIGIL